jgi:hypothetical protein
MCYPGITTHLAQGSDTRITRVSCIGTIGNVAHSSQFTKKQTLEHPLYFEVRVQVKVGSQQMIWTTDVLLVMRVPIDLDSD